MSTFFARIIGILDGYEGRDAAITLTLYFCCLLSGLYPPKTSLHRSFRRISKRLEDCRVVLRLYDDLMILRDLFTYELRPGERNRLVRCLKCLHYLSWLAYYPSEHISWLGEMKMIDIDEKLWQFYVNFFWSTALATSTFWHAYVVFQYLTEKNYPKKEKEERKKSLIPWTAARNAMLATVRDGTELVVAIHYLPRGCLWSSTLTYLQFA